MSASRPTPSDSSKDLPPEPLAQDSVKEIQQSEKSKQSEKSERSKSSQPETQETEVARFTSPWFLKSSDQKTVAFLSCVALLLFGVYWRLNISRGPRVMIDQAPALTAPFLVDINHAAWPELSQLPDIGPVLAQRIVGYRKTHGFFKSHQDLMEVKGIGIKKLRRMQPYLLEMSDLEVLVQH